MQQFIMQGIARFMLWIVGWKIESSVEYIPKRCVVIAAPHTSFFDIFLAYMCSWYHGIDIKVAVAERTMNMFVIGRLLRLLGAIYVDRSKNTGLTDSIVDLMKNSEEFALGIAPEGGRSKRDKWKTGFYQIALKAEVPIVPGYYDYARRVTGFGPLLHASGDIEKDFAKLRNFYAPFQAKWPERQTDIIWQEPLAKNYEMIFIDVDEVLLDMDFNLLQKVWPAAQSLDLETFRRRSHHSLTQSFPHIWTAKEEQETLQRLFGEKVLLSQPAYEFLCARTLSQLLQDPRVHLLTSIPEIFAEQRRQRFLQLFGVDMQGRLHACFGKKTKGEWIVDLSRAHQVDLSRVCLIDDFAANAVSALEFGIDSFIVGKTWNQRERPELLQQYDGRCFILEETRVDKFLADLLHRQFIHPAHLISSPAAEVQNFSEATPVMLQGVNA
jgi:1-acyl-sn-glycerol-3-phosphate acyltransferase